MKTLYKIFGVSLLVLTTFFIGCEDRTELSPADPAETGTVSFSKFVSIGNSLTAGYQNGGLYESSQLNSIGALIAKQVGNVDYEQPLLSNPGTPGRLEVKELDLAAGNISIASNTSQGSASNGSAIAYNNLGIPGIVLADVLTTTTSPSEYVGINPLIDVVLRGKGKTVLEQALIQQPTFVTVWIGNNDILGYATSGGIMPHTPVEIFDQLYQQLIGALAQSGVKGIVANIPDVKAVPFFTTVGPAIAQAISPLYDAGTIAGLVYQMSTTSSAVVGVAPPADLVAGNVLITLLGSSYASLIGDTEGTYYTITGQTPPERVNTAYPFGLTAENPWPHSLILDAEEIAKVQSVTNSFNQSIASAASAVGYKLVDIHSFFNTIAASGITVDGIKFTTSFVSGGLFSLDGVHPTSRGYGIVANQFIKVINSGYGASIPEINVSTIPGSLPLYGEVPGKINSVNSTVGAFDKLLF